MTRHRPSDVEPAISDDNAPVAPAHHRPTWWRVGRVRAIAFICVGLAVALSLASALLSWRAAQVSYAQAQASAEQANAVDERLTVLEQDMAERKAQRDAERDQAAARDAEDQTRINATLCELLGQIPGDSTRLDPLRETLACDQIGLAPPALLDAGQPSSDTTTASSAGTAPATDAAAPEPAPGTGVGAVGVPPPPTSAPASQPAPTTAPAGPTDVDRGVVGDLLCTLQLLC